MGQINENKRALHSKIMIAAHSNISLNIFNNSAIADQDVIANRALYDYLAQRKQVAVEYNNTLDIEARQRLMAMFEMINGNIKDIIGL